MIQPCFCLHHWVTKLLTLDCCVIAVIIYPVVFSQLWKKKRTVVQAWYASIITHITCRQRAVCCQVWRWVSYSVESHPSQHCFTRLNRLAFCYWLLHNLHRLAEPTFQPTTPLPLCWREITTERIVCVVVRRSSGTRRSWDSVINQLLGVTVGGRHCCENWLRLHPEKHSFVSWIPLSALHQLPY